MTFIELLQDIRDGKYPDILLKHEEVVALEALTQTAKTAAVEAHDIVVPLAEQVALDKTAVSDNEAIVSDALVNITSLEQSVEQKHAQVIGLSALATTLSAGTSATASYNPVTGIVTLGIPEGIKGDRGEAFQVSAQGGIADRTLYDLQPENFSFFATDVGEIYFKNSATDGDWGAGISFGKGDDGDAGESINMQIDAGNVMQWQYPSEGAVWHDLIDLDAVYNGTFLGINAKADDSSKLNGKTVLNVLNSTDTTAPLSAAQGKVLNDAIAAVNFLLSSDDISLDQLQEIVDFVKLNRSDLNNLSITSIAGLEDALSSKNSTIGTSLDINTSGTTVIDNIYVTDGVITSMGTRALTATDAGNLIKGMVAGAVGTYVWATEYGTDRVARSLGSTISGSSLRSSSVGMAAASISTDQVYDAVCRQPGTDDNSVLSGTWRLMGGYPDNVGYRDYPMALWLRIA